MVVNNSGEFSLSVCMRKMFEILAFYITVS